MFHILTQALTATGRRLLTIPALSAAEPIWLRREALARMVDVYAALSDAEQALHTAAAELRSIAEEGSAPARVVVRRKLAALASATTKFGARAISAIGLPHISEQRWTLDYFVEISGPKSFMFTPPRVVDLLSLTCPASVDGQGRVSSLVSYPLDAPTRQLLGLDLPDGARRYRMAFAEAPERIPRDVQAQLRHATADIDDRAGLREALGDTSSDTRALRAVRAELSAAIRAHFSLDELLS